MRPADPNISIENRWKLKRCRSCVICSPRCARVSVNLLAELNSAGGPFQRLVPFGIISGSFSCRSHVFGSGSLEQIFGAVHPLAVVAMDREKNTAFLNPSFVAFGLKLWYPHTG